MSINVTVHGNPICIKRGKMVALDKDNNEFEVRRKIRIQQVRQQSKKIAEDVRKKVRKEKDKQLGKINCNVDTAHSEKQNFDLNCLNRNLRCSLEDFGQAYRDAENLPDENELIKTTNLHNCQKAELRGKNAQQLLQEQKDYSEHILNKKNKDLKYARYIEDLRAKLVSDLPKHKKRKRRKPNLDQNEDFENENSESENCTCESDSDSDIAFSDISINITEPDPTKSDMATIASKKSIGSKKSSGKKSRVSTTKKNNSTETVAPCRELLEEIYSNKSSKKSISEIQECSGGQGSSNTLSLKSSQEPPKKSKISWDETSNKENISKKGIYNSGSSCMSNDPNEPDDFDGSCGRPRNWYAEFMKHKENENCSDRDQEDNIGPPCHPVLQSQRGCLEKNRHRSRSPEKERLLCVKKTLTSNKDTKVNKRELKIDNLEKISPVKVPHKIKKKKVKVKSSLHDTNYIKPTLLPCEIDPEICLNVGPKSREEIPDRHGAPIKCYDQSRGQKEIPRETCSRPRELPNVPTTYIREDIPDIQEATVKCYDRFNKFAKEENRPLYIQKICEEDISTIEEPENENTEIPCTRKIQRAKARGIRAMEKVKIEKDYHRLLKELPILEKQERLANMGQCKPSLHMTDERLREYERKKQNVLECKFENMKSRDEQFQRPVITLKSIRKSPPKGCIKRGIALDPLDISLSDMFSRDTLVDSKGDSAGTFNSKGSSCQIGSKGRLSTTCASKGEKDSEETTESTTQTPSSESCQTKCDEDQIADLLKRVNKQRELLLKEALNLKLGNLKDILSEDELYNLICKCHAPKVLKETATSPGQPECQMNRKDGPISKGTQRSQTKVKDCGIDAKRQSSVKNCTTSISQGSLKSKRCPSSNSDSSFDSQSQPQSQNSDQIKITNRTKPKVKKFKIYLREEGTQTSPHSSKGTLSKTKTKSKRVLGKKGSRTSVKSTSKRSTASIPIQVPSCGCVKESSSSSTKEACVKESTSSSNQKSSSSTKKESSSTKDSSTSSDKVCEIIIRADKEVNIRPIVAEKATQDGTEKDVIIKIKEAGVLPCLRNLLNLSTSTSYLSPPCEIKKLNKEKPSQESCRSTNKDLLQPQRQQTNSNFGYDSLVRVENGSKQINPRLVKYITRLLNMSRQSIEELTVSSVSDVSTPQESLVQTSSNVAKEKLQTVMEHFKLSADDIKNFCMSSTTSTLSGLGLEDSTNVGKKFVCASTSTDRLDKDESVQVSIQEKDKNESGGCNRLDCPKFRVYRGRGSSPKRHQSGESPKRCDCSKGESPKRYQYPKVELNSPKRHKSPSGESPKGCYDCSRGESPKRQVSPRRRFDEVCSPKKHDLPKRHVSPGKDSTKCRGRKSYESPKRLSPIEVREDFMFVRGRLGSPKGNTRDSGKGTSSKGPCSCSEKERKSVIQESSTKVESPCSCSKSVMQEKSVIQESSSGRKDTSSGYPCMTSKGESTSKGPCSCSEKKSSNAMQMESSSKGPCSCSERKDTSTGYPFVSSSVCGSRSPLGESPSKQPLIKFCIPKTSSEPNNSTDSTCQTAQDVQNPNAVVTTSSSDEALLKNPQNFLNFVRESLGMSVLEFSELGFEEMFSRHMELTEYCHDRIKSLMTLIEQIRKEKREICCSPVMDHSITLTSYLDLPDKRTSQSPEGGIERELQSCLEQDISSENSLSQDALDRYLLGINGSRRSSDGVEPSSSSPGGSRPGPSTQIGSRPGTSTQGSSRPCPSSPGYPTCPGSPICPGCSKHKTSRPCPSSPGYPTCPGSPICSGCSKHKTSRPCPSSPGYPTCPGSPICPGCTKHKDNTDSGTHLDRLKSGEELPQPFIPMLEGIPKYSTQSQIPSFLSDLLKEIKPRPPPSLLRSNLRGHTNEIPHELSTIAEMDTLISSRNTTLRPEEKVPSRDISPRLEKTKDSKKSPTKKSSPNKSPKGKKKSNSKDEKDTRKKPDDRSSRLEGGLDLGIPLQTKGDVTSGATPREKLELDSKLASKKAPKESDIEKGFNMGIPHETKTKTRGATKGEKIMEQENPKLASKKVQKEKSEMDQIKSKLKSLSENTGIPLFRVSGASPREKTELTTSGAANREKIEVSSDSKKKGGKKSRGLEDTLFRLGAGQDRQENLIQKEGSSGSNVSDGYMTIPLDKTLDKTSGKDEIILKRGLIDASDSGTKSSGLSGFLTLSDTSAETPDELEALLKKFKLEWAISLVKKTEQAMALSSSSSSSDVTRKDVSFELKDKFKNLCEKLASLNESDFNSEKNSMKLISDLSQFKDFHDISEISGLNSLKSKSHQRTSTPVQHSKSNDSNSNLNKKSVNSVTESFFKIDSELSSVKNSSDDNNTQNLFLSIPNITLNTEHISLRKS